MSHTTKTTKTPLNEEYRSPTASGYIPVDIPTVDTKKIPTVHLPTHLPLGSNVKGPQVPTTSIPTSTVKGPQVPVPTSIPTSTVGNKNVLGPQVPIPTSIPASVDTNKLDPLPPLPKKTGIVQNPIPPLDSIYTFDPKSVGSYDHDPTRLPAVPASPMDPTSIPVPITPSVVVSPEHDPIRLNKAKDLLTLLGDLKTLLKEGEGPSKEILTETLQKAEEFIHQASDSPHMDADTRKLLEDINALMVSSRSLSENKQIAERAQNIQKEFEKALVALKSPEIDRATTETAKDIKEFVTNWRSLFYLITSSRDFRVLLLDSINIAKGIIYGYTGRGELSDKFVEKKRLPELSEAEWDRFQSDIRRVLDLIAKEPIYRDGISRIFYLLDLFIQSLLNEPVTAGVALASVAAETEGLVACFSGRETLEHFKAHLRNLILLIGKNEPLKNYLAELKPFVLQVRTEEETRSERFRSESKMNAYRGRELMRELSEEEDLKHFLQACDDLINNIKRDEFLEILRKQAGIVQSDLTFVDSQGQTQVDTQSVLKLQSALLPVLVDALKFIPVPKIYVNDNEKEFWLDNIVLCSYDIVPQHIRFHIQSTSDVDVHEVEVKSHTYLVIELTKLRTEIKDVEFFYLKKTFPHFEEHGKATFRIKGEGAKLTFTYTLDQSPNDILPKITRGHADLDISNMSIDFDKSTLKHDILIPMITKMFKAFIEQQIEKEVEKNLTGFIRKLGDRITQSLSEINKPFLSGLEAAKTVVKTSPLTQDLNSRREKLE